MPFVGRAAAVAAANRSTRQRSATRRTSGTPLVRCEREVSPCDESSESKPSVMAQLKQQVQETGGFFKKYQQEVTKKVAKGIKMVSGTVSSRTDATASIVGNTTTTEAPANTTEAASEDIVSLDPAWLATLSQMGFDSAQVLEAVAWLGGQPSEIDDLLQVLLAMRSSASSGEPAGSTTTLPPRATNTNTRSVANTTSVTNTSTSLPKPQASAPAFPPLYPLSAVGSAEFETAVDKTTVLFPKRIATQTMELDPAVVEALQQMGFSSGAIQDAKAVLGPAAGFDALFNFLLMMGSRQGSSVTTSYQTPMPSSSACPAACRAVREAERPRQSMHSFIEEVMSSAIAAPSPHNFTPDEVAGVIVESTADSGDCGAVVDVSGDDEEDKEPSVPELAGTVVASIVTRVLQRMVLKQDETDLLKQVAKDPLFASPTRGGA